MSHHQQLIRLLKYAIDLKSSDIHITVKKEIKVEFRTLKLNVSQSEYKLSTAFVNYLKMTSGIDVFSALKPQTGQFQIKLNEIIYHVRCAYLKNKDLESIVLRILNPPQFFKFEEIFKADLKDQLLLLLNQTSGLILFSGTTGSGKTTSLYISMDTLNTKKIYSVEDPIEIYRDHIVQLEVNPSIKFGFLEAIKQVLRHDPNIIVIGEIRSYEEAEAAFRCALSGHLVLSTIHANSADLTIRRLLDLGIHKELIYDTLLAVVYQKFSTNSNTLQKELEVELFQEIKGHQALQ
jgi:competence protein ComGA